MVLLLSESLEEFLEGVLKKSREESLKEFLDISKGIPSDPEQESREYYDRFLPLYVKLSYVEPPHIDTYNK